MSEIPGCSIAETSLVKIATWNVNSIRQRETHVQRWVEKNQPDILFLQEIKCDTASFPSLPFHGLGYTTEAVGQKSYNGVAVLGARSIYTAASRAARFATRRRPGALYRNRG